MDKEWEVEYTIKGKTSFFCDTKEEAERVQKEIDDSWDKTFIGG